MLEKFAKTKFRVILLRKEYKTMNVVFVKEFKQLPDFVKFGNRTYKPNWENPSWNNKLDKVYLLDVENGNQLVFKEIEIELNPQELDIIVGNHILKDIVKGISENNKEKILMIVLGFAIGLVLGLFVMQIIMNQKIEELYDKFGLLDLINSGIKPLFGGN